MGNGPAGVAVPRSRHCFWFLVDEIFQYYYENVLKCRATSLFGDISIIVMIIVMIFAPKLFLACKKHRYICYKKRFNFGKTY